MDLQELKNAYAIDQGYEDWAELIHSVINHENVKGIHSAMIAMEYHFNEICIRAEKAVLEKAAENGMVRLNFNNLNDNSGISEKRFIIKDTPGFYEIDRASITNPENLIR